MGISWAAKGSVLTLVDDGPAPARGPAAEAPGDFDAFYRREYPGLVVLACALVGPAAADEVAQQAMLVAFRRWDQVQALGAPADWVRRVCLRRAARLVRRRTAEQVVPRSDALTAGLDVEARLAELKKTSRRRRGSLALVAAAATLTALAGLAPVAARTLVAGGQTPSVDLGPTGCVTSEVVACLAGDVALVRGKVPFTLRLPQGFAGRINPSPGPSLDVLQDLPDVTAGAVILAQVRAADGTDAGTAYDAQGLAEWVASRPYLESTRVALGAVDGHVAWSFETRWPVAAERAGAHACNSVQTLCRAFLRQTRGAARWDLGAQAGDVNRLTFLDVPRLGTVVLWSWAHEGHLERLVANDEMLASVHFRVTLP